MSDVHLSEALLQKAGGWQAMKAARALHAAGKVLSAEWNPPLLTGEVQAGIGPIKTGLRIKSHIHVDNLCPCKESRERGTLCAHALALGIEVLNPTPVRPVACDGEKPKADRLGEAAPPPFPLNLSPEGEPLQLGLILPTAFAQSLAGGSVSVFIEAVMGNRRLPLVALARDGVYALPPDHQQLLEHLVAWADGELPATLKLNCQQLAEMLDVLPPGVASFGRKEPVVIREEVANLKLTATLLDSGEIRLAAEIPKPLPVVIPGPAPWLLQGATFSRLQLPGGSLALLQAPQVISRQQVPAFLQEDFPVLSASGSFTANFLPDDFEIAIEPPTLRLELEGGLARLRARLSAAYGNDVFSLPSSVNANGGGNAVAWLVDPDNVRRYRLRDLSAEQGALARLQRIGFAGPDQEGRLQLSGQDSVLSYFANHHPRLQCEWQVTLEERLDWSLGRNVERIEPRCEVRSGGSGEQWFDFGVRFQSSGGEAFSNADIQSLIRGGRSHTKLKNGKFALLDTDAVEEFQELLLDTAPQQDAGGYRMKAEQAAFLNETLGGKLGWKIEAPTAWRDRIRSRAGEVKLGLVGFEKILRPYQKDGVRWLHELRSNGFGGILADEMGLGKTLQALAHMALHRADHGSGPSLVVCPTTLVFNWAAETAKFAPQLRVLVLQGPDRHGQFPGIQDHDLVITSYALIRRDADAYRAVEFDTVILDEAQHIKNRQSQNAQAVKSIRSRHRLVLTGTPMENSVLDLWSIFDFLMPGYLGSANDFRERYELPLSKDRNPGLQDRLSRRVRPFLLRRLKREVAKDLPAKLEQISYCELTGEQRAIYQQVLEAGRKEVLDSVCKQGMARSRMVIFTALLRLRQICCDLRLLELDAARIKEPSGKLDLFAELLEEVLDGGHRALVFSQFTSMLALLKERLEAESIDYCYLDGSTRNRGDVVRAFQQGKAPVFLISLKAGGVGLNLTAADTVVHFDPWWNPAVEDQATDRAHRIGQRRVVTSYKLITRDTVEEKILKLQEKKREAIQAVYGDETALAEALTWDEVQELFA